MFHNFAHPIVGHVHGYKVDCDGDKVDGDGDDGTEVEGDNGDGDDIKVYGDGVARDCGGAAGRRPDGAQHLAQGVNFLNLKKIVQHLTKSCTRGSASPRHWRPLQGHPSAKTHISLLHFANAL